MATFDETSRENIIEKLILSHWTLKEIVKIIEQTPTHLGSDFTAVDFDDAFDVEGAAPSVFEKITTLDEQLDQRQRDVQQAQSDTTITGLETAVEDLRGQVQEFQEYVRRDERERSAPTSHSTTVDGLHEQLENPAADQDSTSTGRPTQIEVSELSADIAEFKESITTRHESLRERVELEFEDLHDILGYLIDADSDLDARLQTELGNARTIIEHLTDAQESADSRADTLSVQLHDLLKRQDENEKLTRLWVAATRLGSSNAKCESCGTVVDVYDLKAAGCPECDHEFQELVPPTGWLGLGSNTLRIIEEPVRDSPARKEVEGETRQDADGDSREPVNLEWTAGKSRGVQFEWVGDGGRRNRE